MLPPPLRLTRAPSRELIAHAELKVNNALVEILHFLRFTSVPSAAAYQWCFFRSEGCHCCGEYKTACHIPHPKLHVTGPWGPWGLPNTRADLAYEVALVLGMCERCAFCGAECNLAGAKVLFTYHLARATWEMHTDLHFGHDSNWQIAIDKAHWPKDRQHRVWADLPSEICGALWDVCEVTERLEAARRLKEECERVEDIGYLASLGL